MSSNTEICTDHEKNVSASSNRLTYKTTNILQLLGKTTPAIAESKWQKRPLSLKANVSAVSIYHRRLLSLMVNVTAKAKWHMLKWYKRLQIVLISSKHNCKYEISLSLGNPHTFAIFINVSAHFESSRAFATFLKALQHLQHFESSATFAAFCGLCNICNIFLESLQHL